MWDAFSLGLRTRRYLNRLRYHYDATFFLSERADYYAYLADLLHGLQGKKTLRDVFFDDAIRYGTTTVRGRLSAHWCQAYEENGGDLALAWSGTFPEEECLLISAAQKAGGGALDQALRDLADTARLVQKAKHIARSTLMVAALAGIVAMLVIMAVPYFTVPRLERVFSVVPYDYYGRLTKHLFGLAQFIQDWFWVVLVIGLGAIVLSLAALPYWTGSVRRRLDRYFIWRLYRNVLAIRFVCMLAVLLRQRGNIDTRLRQALMMLSIKAEPWFNSHLEQMISYVEAGCVGGDTFNTGLLDLDMVWFLDDMIAAQGMEQGLLQARYKIEQRMLAQIAAHAHVIRWVVLLASVFIVMGLALWHYAVIDELRRAMTHFYSSR